VGSSSGEAFLGLLACQDPNKTYRKKLDNSLQAGNSPRKSMRKLANFAKEIQIPSWGMQAQPGCTCGMGNQSASGKGMSFRGMTKC